jgi:hypothetical protein
MSAAVALPHPDLRQAAAQVLGWWRGEASLPRTVAAGALISLGGHALWWLIEDDIQGPVYTQGALMLLSTWIALTTALMLLWAVPVFRVCLRRLGEPKSLVWTFVVFMTTLVLLVQGMVENFNASVQWVQVQRAEHRAKWQPLEVYADPALGRIVAKGDITAHSADEFERVVLANPQYGVVQIESYGGYVYDAHRMADLILARHLNTVSFVACASACTLMFAAGEQRFLGPTARFGFHRSGYPTMPRFAPASAADRRHAQFLRSRGVSEDFIERDLATPYFTIWKPSQAEMFAAGFATHRWSERPVGW